MDEKNMGDLMLKVEMNIGEIGNYYGGLSVKKNKGKYYWSIENYDGENWEEIPKYLYETLVKYEKERVSSLSELLK